MAPRAELPEDSGVNRLGCQTAISASIDAKGLFAPLANPCRTTPDPDNKSSIAGELAASLQEEGGEPCDLPGELCSEPHPRKKITDDKNKSPPPAAKRSRGRPPTHGLSRKPIYRSFHEAKLRCTDVKNPDYPGYGGRGIEFRFKSVADLFNAIGDRPAGKTLDRIDANGHYEVGNVRWADAKEQANNRRPPSHYVREAQSLRWHRERDARESYLLAARHWLLSVKCINDHTKLSAADISFLEERHAATEIPYATFWEREASDEPNYAVLPRLNSPGGRVVLRIGPRVRFQNDRFTDLGLLFGTENIPLSLNCSQRELDTINRFVVDVRRGADHSGLVYSGCSQNFNDNCIEGRLLATAGRLTASKLKASVVLSAQLAVHLSVGIPEHLLQNEYLFLPDLQVWPALFGYDRLMTYRLREILGDRASNGLPTIVYVEDGMQMQLGPEFASLFMSHYQEVNLCKISPIPHQFSREAQCQLEI